MWLLVLSIVAFLTADLLIVIRHENYVLLFWSLGLTLALSWGFKDWWKVRRINWLDIGLVALLYAFALYLRTGFDLRGLPAFVDNDELHLLGESVKLAAGTYKLLDIFWVGIPIFGLFPQALAFQIFEPSILSSRASEAVFAALVVIAVYDLGRSLVNRRVAFGAAFLVAVSHECIHWSRVGISFILIPTFAAIMMAFAVRALKGGSKLSWIGSAVALGFGVMSYQAGYFFPILLWISSLPLFLWNTKITDKRKAFGVYSVISFIGILIASPPLLRIMSMVNWGGSRPATLLISESKLPNLANTYGIPRTPISDVLIHHIKQSATVLWNGSDAWAQYGARYPLVDGFIGAAILLLPFALLFGNRIVAWMSLSWITSYLVIGVLLVGTPPTYHRISTVVIFAALGAATIVDWIAPKRFKFLVLTIFCLASGYCNLKYYFYTYPTQRLPHFSSVVTRIMSPYKNSHTIIDASHAGVIPPEQKNTGTLVYHHELLKAELRGAKIIEILDLDDIWNIQDSMGSAILIVCRSEQVDQIGVRPPPSYTIVNSWKDDSTGAPQRVSLSVFELTKM